MIARFFRASYSAFSEAIAGLMFRPNMARPTLYNRWKRWSEAGVFERVFDTLARETADLSILMIDASHVKTHRIAANGVKKQRRRA